MTSPPSGTETLVMVASIALIIGVPIFFALRRARGRRAAGGVPSPPSVDRERLLSLRNQWRPPPELLPSSTPRRVVLTKRPRVALVAVGLFAIAMVVITLQLHAGLQRKVDERSLVERDGVATDAIVVERRERRYLGISHYMVRYQYTVAGQRYQASGRVSFESSYLADTVGAPIAVHRSESQPALSRLDGTIEDSPWTAFTFLLPAAFFLFMLYSLSRQRRLLAWGSATGAIVIRTARLRGGVATWFAFLDAAGTVVTGSGTAPSGSQLEPGAIIAVIFDPERPDRNAPYPFIAVRIDQ